MGEGRQSAGDARRGQVVRPKLDRSYVRHCGLFRKGADRQGADPTGSLRRVASQEAKPLSHACMALGCFRKKVVLAGFAAEAQAPMMVADKTKFSATVCATVLQLGHEALPPTGALFYCPARAIGDGDEILVLHFNRIGVVQLPSTRLRVELLVDSFQNALSRDFDPSNVSCDICATRTWSRSARNSGWRTLQSGGGCCMACGWLS